MGRGLNGSEAQGRGVLPVFQGFDAADVRGRDLAERLGVSPPTISKWRLGRLMMPVEMQAFLTLLLADELTVLEERETFGAWRFRHLDLDAVRRCLRLQEALNDQLPPEAMRQGAQLFRDWWLRGGDAGAGLSPLGPRPARA